MKPWIKWALALNLAALAVLVFAYPHFMVAPGKLIPAHKEMEQNCFACHKAFFGIDETKCASCHKPSEIGLLTTKGLKIFEPKTKVAFHQDLNSQNCTACHSDHSGVTKFIKKGKFDHALLNASSAKECQTCHKPPVDDMHKKMTGNCSSCHQQTAWKPATFDHSKFFVLDRHHDATCSTCHPRNDYKQYTCYGCHEHSLDKIRREHIEEGISDFQNCVECHRSGNEHDIIGRGLNRSRESGKNEGRGGDDD